MAVKIRFARVGKKHAPIYRIVAIDSRRKRDGMCLENLGTYNPKTKELVQFHDERVAHWISMGATPTEAVARLMKIRQKQNPSLVAPVKPAAPKVKKEAKAAAPKKASEAKPAAAKKSKEKAA